MNPTHPPVSWQVRPPWPDEVERLPPAVREAMGRRGTRRHWPLVLVAGELERIVGAASLAERDPRAPAGRPDARIDFVLLPAWRGASEPVAALLAATVERAASLGLAPLEVQANLDTAAAAWLEAHGFARQREHEVWRVPFASNFAHRHAAIERALGRHPVAIRPLDETALPAVRAICAAHGLLTPERVVLARANADGLDPRVSFVAGPPAAPTAILLARSAGRHIYLEVLARAPGGPARGPEIGALLHVFFRAAMQLGAPEAICVLATAHAPDTVRLLARADAERLERFAVFCRS